jgi:hypothetical protein
MHSANRFDQLTIAMSALLAEHAGEMSDADIDELADLIAQSAVINERDGAAANLQNIEERLSQIAARLKGLSQTLA